MATVVCKICGKEFQRIDGKGRFTQRCPDCSYNARLQQKREYYYKKKEENAPMRNYTHNPLGNSIMHKPEPAWPPQKPKEERRVEDCW